MANSLSHAMNLWLGMAMDSHLVLISQPNIVLVLDSPFSASCLFSARGFSLVMGSVFPADGTGTQSMDYQRDGGE